jgi:hypothetical protein
MNQVIKIKVLIVKSEKAKLFCDILTYTKSILYFNSAF